MSILITNKPGSNGTVTSVSVISANGLAGTVATATTTPAITLSTTLNTPVIAGNGTSLIAATTTGSGSVVLATSPTLATPSLGSTQIHNVADPSSAQDAATKNYVDTAVAALQPLTSVYAATTGSNIPGTYLNGVAGVGATFTTTSTATFTVDGVTPPLTSRILIKDQTSGFQNGVYGLTTAAVPGVSGTIFTRTFDYDTASDMNAAGLIPVINGTLNALSSWQQVAIITTVGTDSLVFTEFTANPSLYLLKANNLSDVASKATSYNNLSPMTTTGDIEYEASAGVAARLPIGSTGNVLKVVGGLPAWAANTITLTAPTVQKFASGSGTYTTPTSPSPLYIKVTVVGGGAGGTGSGTSAGNGAGGTTSTFGSSLLTANGGNAATYQGTGGTGGSATITTSSTVLQIIADTGGSGQGGGQSTQFQTGGMGGSNARGGAGAGGAPTQVGMPAIVNTGGGGGGAGTNGAYQSGYGSGAGGYLQAYIISPSSTYSYAVGGGGSGGAAGGSNGAAGGAGGSGIIIVEEFYQ